MDTNRIDPNSIDPYSIDPNYKPYTRDDPYIVQALARNAQEGAKKAEQSNLPEETIKITNELDLGPTDGIQLKFAKLLLQLSNSCKTQANNYMKEIEGIQEKQRDVAERIERARTEINAIGDSKTASTVMTDKMKDFFIKHDLKFGVPVAGKPGAYTKEQWEFNLKSLTNYQDQIGTKTQSLMVMLQDFIGQYNANLTGAKTAITDFNDMLKTLLR